MLVDDPKDYEELHELALELNQDLCIHITEDMLTMTPDQTNGYSGIQSLPHCIHSPCLRIASYLSALRLVEL